MGVAEVQGPVPVHEDHHHSHHLAARTHQEAIDAAVEGTGKPLTLGHDVRPDPHPHGARPQPNDPALMGHPVAGPHLHHSDAKPSWKEWLSQSYLFDSVQFIRVFEDPVDFVAIPSVLGSLTLNAAVMSKFVQKLLSSY